MLFAVKNRLLPTLLLLGVLVVVSVFLARLLDIRWSLQPTSSFVRDFAVAALIVGTSDALLFGVCTLLFRRAFLQCYVEFIGFFRQQGIAEIVAGGLLAGAEELLFRGLVLDGLHTLAHLPGWLAVLLSALLFGLCHWLPSRPVRVFFPWAIWEGVLLGGVYVITGSLLICIVLHAAHDLFGFALFAHQRRTGWLLGPKNS